MFANRKKAAACKAALPQVGYYMPSINFVR